MDTHATFLFSLKNAHVGSGSEYWRGDKHNVSFVSVTQQFNTTTSMGRLTLNVLLSFAQFEREVTSERIRDKIAAYGSAARRRLARTPKTARYSSITLRLTGSEPSSAVTCGSAASTGSWRRRSVAPATVELDADGIFPA